MAHFLQLLLEIKDPLFSIGLKNLEKSTGNSGLDARLAADIIEKSHKIMRHLGLDTRDTTAHELYNSLIATAKSNQIKPLLENSDYILCIIKNQVISFNLIDVMENFHNKLPFDKRVCEHGQKSLRGEILSRYMENLRTNESTTIETAKIIGLL